MSNAHITLHTSNSTNQPDREWPKQQKAASHVSTFLEAVPMAPFLAFGFILAWSQLAHSSVLSLPMQETSASLPSLLSISTCCNGLTLLLCGLFLKPVKRLLASNGAIIAAGTLTGLSGAVVLACADSSASYEKAYCLMSICYAVRGIGSALVFLKVATLYSRLSGRSCIMYLGWSHVLAACIFFITIGLSDYSLGESANCIAVWSGIIILPVCAALFSILRPNANTPIPENEAVYTESIRTLPSSFWRFVVVIFAFSFVMSLSSFLGAKSTGMGLDAQLTNFARIVAAFILIGTALFFDAEQFKLGKTYVVIVVLSISVIALCPVVCAVFAGWSTLAGIAMLLFRMLHWVILSLIVCQRHISPVFAFGIGAGVQALGAGLGNIVPLAFLEMLADPTLNLIASVVCILLILFCAFVLFSEKEMDNLFSPTNPDSIEFVDLFGPILTGTGTPTNKAAENDPEYNAAIHGNASNAANQNDLLAREGKAPVVGTKKGSGADAAKRHDDLSGVPQDSNVEESPLKPKPNQPQSVHSESTETSRGKISFNEAVALCSKQFGLSKREIDVFRYLAMGYNAQIIAEKLFISWNTVRGHSRNIYTKLGVHSRAEVMSLVDTIRENPSSHEPQQ